MLIRGLSISFGPIGVVPIAVGEAARRYYSWLFFLHNGAKGVLSPNFIQPDTNALVTKD
jgi:hypothetical protein